MIHINVKINEEKDGALRLEFFYDRTKKKRKKGKKYNNNNKINK